ncbi:hypothetical protein Y032_0023g865 [Ancylostoma ceylanicum]|uniref:MI domain-containing protein n=1 Tax=Ancylostoma ceylanicum TaxID=53326 RepID=A0A016V055_9BILA|nr:hypothetical protein Y032_0023g865 [Ancylostoma ceylanicum]
MPFPKYTYEEEDPEEVAERELEKKIAELGLPDTRGPAAAVKKSLPAAPQPSPVRPVAKHPKEAKALRKKRNRGVSGSSIKKDGGRFDMGFDYEDFADDDIEERTEDIEAEDYREFCRQACGSFSSRSVGFGSMESDSEASNDSTNAKANGIQVSRVREVLLSALSHEDDGFCETSLADLFADEYDETGRVKLLHDAVSSICKKKDEIVADPQFEYRLVTLMARLVQQGLLKDSSVVNYAQHAQNKDHGIRLLDAAITEPAKDRDESKLLMQVEKLAKELATEYDPKEVAEDLTSRDAPFYHVNFVNQLCIEAISSMNMDVIYFVSTAIRDLLDHGTVEPWSVNVGFERFFKNIPGLEVDLPGATSLATMLMSYAANDMQIITESVASLCPKPTRFIKAGAQGKLSVVKKEQEECNDVNYFFRDE